MLTFEYITANNAVSFSEDSDFWITGIDGLSSNEINISETQGRKPDRFHPLVPVGTAQGPHGHGRIVWKPERKQADAAVLRESNDPGTFLHP